MRGAGPAPRRGLLPPPPPGPQESLCSRPPSTAGPPCSTSPPAPPAPGRSRTPMFGPFTADGPPSDGLDLTKLPRQLEHLQQEPARAPAPACDPAKVPVPGASSNPGCGPRPRDRAAPSKAARALGARAGRHPAPLSWPFRLLQGPRVVGARRLFLSEPTERCPSQGAPRGLSSHPGSTPLAIWRLCSLPVKWGQQEPRPHTAVRRIK